MQYTKNETAKQCRSNEVCIYKTYIYTTAINEHIVWSFLIWFVALLSALRLSFTGAWPWPFGQSRILVRLYCCWPALAMSSALYSKHWTHTQHTHIHTHTTHMHTPRAGMAVYTHTCSAHTPQRCELALLALFSLHIQIYICSNPHARDETRSPQCLMWCCSWHVVCCVSCCVFVCVNCFSSYRVLMHNL